LIEDSLRAIRKEREEVTKDRQSAMAFLQRAGLLDAQGKRVALSSLDEPQRAKAKGAC
jgi:hypothetical protein